MDPYLQIDAWTISPYEHGEVFVTEDWGETDLDIWNYERFLWKKFYKDNNITTWKIYLEVIQKERKWTQNIKNLGRLQSRRLEIISPEVKHLIREAKVKLIDTILYSLQKTQWLPRVNSVFHCSNKPR